MTKWEDGTFADIPGEVARYAAAEFTVSYAVIGDGGWVVHLWSRDHHDQLSGFDLPDEPGLTPAQYGSGEALVRAVSRLAWADDSAFSGRSAREAAKRLRVIVHTLEERRLA